MLPDQVTELLTAFVDGELSQRQRKAVTKLLQRSSEAREVLRHLQENAHKIKQLPRRKVEPSLVDEILRAIAERKAQPAQPALKPARRRHWLPYVVAGLAASLLIGAIGLLYYQSMDQLAKLQQPIIAVNPEKKLEPAPIPELPTPKKMPNPLLHALVDGTYREFGQPVLPDPVFTARFSDLKNEAGAVAGQLKHELNKDRTVQFEITVKDNAIAIERLNRALVEQGIKVVTDPRAKKELAAKKQPKGEYWVYAENLTRDELAKMMSELSQIDTTGMGKAVPSPYEKVTVTPIAKTEKQTLAGKLGVDAGKLELPKDQGNAKPEAPKRWERQAVVLPTGAATSPSKEVVVFVNQRRQPQAGTLQVLIKIRQE